MIEQNYPEVQRQDGVTSQEDKMLARMEMASNIADQVNQFGNIACNVASTAERVADLYAECKRVEAQTEQVKAWSQVEIAKTIAKYKSCQEFMYHTFGERDKALTKHYDLLDKAIAGNDKELIIAALRGIGGIVTKSPLEDLEQFAKLYEDTSQTLLDF